MRRAASAVASANTDAGRSGSERWTRMTPSISPKSRSVRSPEVELAVVGAHLSDQPLNPQLLSLGAHFDRTTTTAPGYRLHALSTTPPKPGLVHIGEGGAAIEAEVWRLPAEGLGRLLAALPRPMALGGVELADGTRVPGFLCEPGALSGAEDITAYGGWRAYLRRDPRP
ncbi:hypothetical protein AQJ91_38975 [Streptomyces dysideae]|uniref:Allophanate hydrolase C-terminal domain-containing protein n=1 Tax=Streptomyces dysideae TaxID=909626 RepID=A0A124IDQ3_9ACTN|nr:hypothetical protein AQJ91_38975 [Streptomyces dysideae]